MQGISVALAVTIVGMLAPPFLFPADWAPGAEVSERLAFVARWDLLILVWLPVTIGAMARHRFFTPDDIDGSGLTPGTETARVRQAVLQNTLEQTVLAVTLHAAALALLPTPWISMTAPSAVLFFVGRLLFWRGYRGGAASRAVGFGLTFYPQLVLLVAILVTVFS